MISKNYKKVAIIEVNKPIQNNGPRLHLIPLDISLNFNPKRVILIFDLDNVVYPENKNRSMLGRYGEGYIESVSSKRINLWYKADNPNSGGTTLQRIIAIG